MSPRAANRPEVIVQAWRTAVLDAIGLEFWLVELILASELSVWTKLSFTGGPEASCTFLLGFLADLLAREYILYLDPYKDNMHCKLKGRW